jgi:CO/xanthine dehydrogenase Mo-binding subunit
LADLSDRRHQGSAATIDIVLVNHPEAMSTGAGEATMRPLAAALNNAIFEATAPAFAARR